MSTRLSFFLVVSLLLVAVFGVLGFRWISHVYLASQNIVLSSLPKSEEIALPTLSVPPADLLEAAWSVREHWDVPSSTRILLAPHHLIASKEIASLLSSLPFQPSTVFVISPDHFSQGRTALTTSRATFVSTQASTTVQTNTVERLLDQLPYLRNNDKPFTNEHGVHALLPFIDKAWPETSVVPVLVRDDAASSTLAELAFALSDELTRDPSVLLLVSMDFSHYLPAELADFHDERTIAAMRALDVGIVPDLETDISGPLIVGLQTARELGLGDVRVHAHTNSLRIAKAVISQDSTSHLLVSFSPGQTTPSVLRTRLIFGRHQKDLTDPLKYLRGPEGRLLRGQDETVFDRPDPRFPDMLVAEIRTSTSTRQLLFPLVRRQDGTDFLTGPSRLQALAQYALKYQEPLRSQIRRGIVEW